MFKIKRVTQFCLWLLAITSSVMLSISIDSQLLLVFAIVGTTLGFLVADLWGKFRIEGWLANVVSIVILLLAMKDFFPSDSAGKLISVANLLVYLQIVLMFQDKTPRLNWQVMVLSLLQVVITAIFSLNFEGSLLILVYFVLAACVMTLQCVYSDSANFADANENNANRLKRHLGIGSSFLSDWKTQDQRNVAKDMQASLAWAPVAIFDSTGIDARMAVPVLLNLATMFLISIAFTTVLFLMAPSQNRPWFSPISHEVASAGLQKKVELNDDELIVLPSATIFRAVFEDHDTQEPIRLSEPAYFRGIALSSLVIENDMTTWRAPNERIVGELYQEIPTVTSSGKNRLADVSITTEESNESMVYGVMPFFSNEGTPRGIEFCHELSAITRCRVNTKVDLLPYPYKFTTIVSPGGATYRSWPYISNTRNYRRMPMSNDPIQKQYLTLVDRDRYPKLCEIADEISRKVAESNGSRKELVRQMENHFLNPANYKYSLDYTEVERDPKLDPVEDFVVNYRQGHCSLFASAMTIMLRSQGIPARLVTGFHGGDYSDMTQKYIVRARHAHAWVEVYLRPEDCDSAMLSNGSAGKGGAWLVADPTPPNPDMDFDMGAGDAIELARTVWQDYMLGNNNSDQGGDSPYAMPLVRFFERFKFDNMSRSLSSNGMSPILNAALLFLGGLVLMIPLIRFLIRKANYDEEKPATAVGRLKRFFADAIGLISPDLREWVIGNDARTNFYVQMASMLKSHGLERGSNQTHREFAQESLEKFSDHPAFDKISSAVTLVTDRFNEVRFGRRELPPEQRKEIDRRLDELEACL